MSEEQKGVLYYFEGRILFASRGLSAESHSHYAVSILISVGSPFHITDLEGKQTPFQTAVVCPNYHHSLDAEQSDIIVLQIDPDSEDYAPIEERFGKTGIHKIPENDLKELEKKCKELLLGNYNCSSALDLFLEILSAVGNKTQTKVSIDPRILSATDRMKKALPEALTVPVLAKEFGFSETRFMHLFKEQLGLPVRKYQLWLRLHSAAKLLKDGVTLTDAAHAAGFADQAHLSRTFKKMFGVQPSRFLGPHTGVKAHFCV
ncbi:AraC family transcriptional regulator [Leptospira perolatii]|uniref:AraC family transcriptional regulator n=1 Tax=Leptospira perolatii TaxID=2023191 RepID=A0A2M9ZNP5_9LEPT|nr:AraC family transcriptional regulator [Leptospira perolatii]PJZ69624.1 AraC family transcriptional regulator [Leptospira perolatii]PJZ73611.1 AraC family transcriptional regulator [Leptospira perolatii]